MIATDETHTVEEFLKYAFEYIDMDYHEYLEIETGTFKETDVNIPSYRDIAIQISSIAENKSK